MRELKFRAWDKKRKKMCFDIQNTYDNTSDEIRGDCFGDLIDQEKRGEIIIMQFTGVKDKNGKEIFEGDIVKGIFDDEIYWIEYIPEEGSMGYLKKVNGKDSGGRLHGTDGKTTYFEVIGNIYENPELLEVQK